MKTRLLLCVLLLVGCDDSMPTDAGGGGSDAGPTTDAGGGGTDAGPDMDAGDTDAGDTDAGVMTDADVMTDAGMMTDGGVMTDAGFDGGTDAGPSCGPDLDVQDDGSGVGGGVGLPSLVLSEIAPGMFIELWNTTASPIDLSSSTMQLYSPVDSVALSTHAPSVIVPAHGYATVPWPTSFTDTTAGGEIILYRDAVFTSGGSILDFVCWGTNPHETRRTLAITSGKWQLGCAAALDAGSIARLPTTTGLRATHYDVTSAPTPDDCAP